jgi:hypothetical protein
MGSPCPPCMTDYYILAIVIICLVATAIFLCLLLANRQLARRLTALEKDSERLRALEAEAAEMEKDHAWLRNEVIGHFCRVGQFGRLMAEARGFFALHAPEVLERAGMVGPTAEWSARWPEVRDPMVVEEPGERRMASVEVDVEEGGE